MQVFSRCLFQGRNCVGIDLAISSATPAVSYSWQLSPLLSLTTILGCTGYMFPPGGQILHPPTPWIQGNQQVPVSGKQSPPLKQTKEAVPPNKFRYMEFCTSLTLVTFKRESPFILTSAREVKG